MDLQPLTGVVAGANLLRGKGLSSPGKMKTLLGAIFPSEGQDETEATRLCGEVSVFSILPLARVETDRDASRAQRCPD